MKNFFVAVLSFAMCGSLALAAKSPRSMARPGPVDRAFVQELAQANAMEIVLANLCLERCTSDDAREVGEMMLESHTLTGERLVVLMERRGLKAQPLERPSEVEKTLMALNPTDFDAGYIGRMVTAHQKTLALLEAQAKAGKDPQFKQFAVDLLPTIRHHLATVERVQETLVTKL